MVGNVVRLFLPTSSNAAYSLARIWILDGFYSVPTKMDRSSVCPRQVPPFYAPGKSMILQQVPLLPSIKLNQHSGAVLTTVFSSCWLLPSLTHHALEQRHSVTNGDDKLSHVGSFNTKNFFSEGQKNLVNSENNKNLSHHQLLKQKPSLWSISLHLSIFLTIVQLCFAWHRFLQWF